MMVRFFMRNELTQYEKRTTVCMSKGNQMSNSTTLYGSAALTYAYEISSLDCLRKTGEAVAAYKSGRLVESWAEANRLAETGDLAAVTWPEHPHHADAMAEVNA